MPQRLNFPGYGSYNFITGSKLTVDGRTYTLKNNVYVAGFGKAVSGMARTLEDLIGQHVVRGVISIPHGSQELFKAYGKEYVFQQESSGSTFIDNHTRCKRCLLWVIRTPDKYFSNKNVDIFLNSS